MEFMRMQCSMAIWPARFVFLMMALSYLKVLFAQEIEPRCDRPLILREGQGLVGLDLAVDVSEGRAGKRVEVGTFHPPDRRDGLSFSFGASRDFEFGAAIQVLWHQSTTTPFNRAKGTEFGGFYAYGLWAFLPYAGLEVGLQAPSKVGWDHVRVRRVALLIGLPFKFFIIPQRLGIRGQADLLMGFALKYYSGDEGPPQYTVFSEVGATLNVTEEVFFEVSAGAGRVLKGRDLDVQGLIAPPGKDVFVPISIQAGWSVTEGLDLTLAWTFPDLHGLTWRSRFVSIGLDYRY